MATKLQDGNTPCLAATPSEPRPTVLVFDSGVGGLSVYDEIGISYRISITFMLSITSLSRMAKKRSVYC